MGKIPWFPLKTMEHGAGAKFHRFHGEIPMLSMVAWTRKIVTVFPMKAWKAWNIKPCKTMENIGYNHGKPWKAWKAWEFTKMKAWKAWEAWYF